MQLNHSDAPSAAFSKRFFIIVPGIFPNVHLLLVFSRIILNLMLLFTGRGKLDENRRQALIAGNQAQTVGFSAKEEEPPFVLTYIRGFVLFALWTLQSFLPIGIISYANADCNIPPKIFNCNRIVVMAFPNTL